jgi:charged multivesicular body protein 2A
LQGLSYFATLLLLKNMALFGSKPKPTPQEMAKAAKKETKKTVRGAQRDVEREVRELDRSEQTIMADIKKRAKTPGINPSKDKALATMAKQLVNTRQQKEKLLSSKYQLGAMNTKASVMTSQIGAANAMNSVTAAMGKMNSAVDAKEMSKMMMEFQKQTEIMNMKEELMDDALTDAFDNDEIEEEAEEITSQVLAELGVELDSQMVGLNAPRKNLQSKVAAVQEEEDDMLPDLRDRLNAL